MRIIHQAECQLNFLGLSNNRRLLGVLASKDKGDVGGEQVVHLVGQGGLEGQLGEGGGVPDGETEGGRRARPVHDVGQRQGCEDFLKQRTLEPFYAANSPKLQHLLKHKSVDAVSQRNFVSPWADRGRMPDLRRLCFDLLYQHSDDK